MKTNYLIFLLGMMLCKPLLAQFSYFSKPFSTGNQSNDISAGGVRIAGLSEGTVTISNIDGTISMTSLNNFGTTKPSCYDPTNPITCQPCIISGAGSPVYLSSETFLLWPPNPAPLSPYLMTHGYDVIELSSIDGLIAICGSVQLTTPNMEKDILIIIADITGKVYGYFHFGKITHDEVAKAITLSDYINPTTGYNDIYINGEENLANSSVKNGLVAKFTFSFVGGVPNITEVWNSSIVIPTSSSISGEELIQSGNSIYCVGNAVFGSGINTNYGVSFELDEPTGNIIPSSNFNLLYNVEGNAINNMVSELKTIKKLNNDIYIGGSAYRATTTSNPVQLDLDFLLIKFSGASISWERLYDNGTITSDRLASILPTTIYGSDRIYMAGTTDYEVSPSIIDKQCSIIDVDDFGSIIPQSCIQYGTTYDEFATELSEDVGQRFFTLYNGTNAPTYPYYKYAVTNFDYINPEITTCFSSIIYPTYFQVETEEPILAFKSSNNPIMDTGSLCEKILNVEELSDCAVANRIDKGNKTNVDSNQINSAIEFLNNETLLVKTNCEKKMCQYSYNIYDFMGKLVISGNNIKLGGEFPIDISNLHQGQFIIHMYDSSNSLTYKFYKN